MEEKITLEKLDILRERADLSYQEAKELLELCDGDVVQALIELEHRPKKESSTETFFNSFSGKPNEILEKIKGIMEEGKVTRIRVSHEGKVLTEIPVAVGALGSVFLPQLTILAGILAMFRKCTIELVKKEDEYDEDTVYDDEDIVVKMESDSLDEVGNHNKDEENTIQL